MNKSQIIILILIFITQVKTDGFHSTLGHIKTQTKPEKQEKATQELIQRIIPERAQEFTVKIHPELGPDGKDTFQIAKQGDFIRIRATTGVAAATAFNYYLKYYCQCYISWQTSQLNLPKILPQINTTITLNDRFRYYQNVCTTSYSFVWWNWQQWQKHIDWIAMNSFNLVLAFNGQEAIWQRVYKKFNLTQDEIDEHFSGPAFLSWLRMGNIRGWGGILPQSWHDRSLELQKLILDRMRSLGIIPVLPAFAGHLPRAFKRLFPNAEMAKMQPWNRFNDTYCCPYFLDPTEELFHDIGREFMREQIKEFGSDHVYNCDSFNENTPASGSLLYLANVGKATYRAMVEVDPKAIWILQSWLFQNDPYWQDQEKVHSFLTSIPLGRMIVLDLQSEQFPQYERFNQYFGQPYIWCMLHNFGGTLGMFGSAEIINKEPIRARNLENSTMVGVGLTPEGINQNYVIYDLMSEFSWRKNSVDLDGWFRNYTIRRYGQKETNAMIAWEILQKTVYNFKGLHRIRGHYAITRSPSLKISTWVWYDILDFFKAWKYLLVAPLKNDGFLHDLVDVTRQALQLIGDHLYNQINKSIREKNLEEFQDKSEKFLDLFQDLEEILASNPDFLLGKWLKSARKCANNTLDSILYEFNARNQITLWGPNGEIMNYANKQWSGIVSNFFHPRWRLFIDYLNETLWKNSTFNQAKIKKKIFVKVEQPFTLDREQFPTDSKGDSVLIARRIYEKWARQFH